MPPKTYHDVRRCLPYFMGYNDVTCLQGSANEGKVGGKLVSPSLSGGQRNTSRGGPKLKTGGLRSCLSCFRHELSMRSPPSLFCSVEDITASLVLTNNRTAYFVTGAALYVSAKKENYVELLGNIIRYIKQPRSSHDIFSSAF